MTSVSNVDYNVPLATVARNQPFSLFFPGSDMYGKVRTNASLTVTGSDNEKAETQVASRLVGPLVNLVPQYGEMFLPILGRARDGASVGDALDEVFPDNPRSSSLAEIYTVIVFHGLPDRIDPA